MATSTLTDLTGSSGYVRLQWTNAEEPANFYAWRLHQRTTGEPTWTLIYETTTSQASYTHDTYGWANSSQQIVLVHVVQSPTTGALTESDKTGAHTFTPTGDSNFTIVHPTTPSASVKLTNVTRNPHRNEIEHQKIPLLDVDGEQSGYKINRGGFKAETGSLSFTLYDDATLGTARARKQKLKELVLNGEPVFLRDPFGKMIKVFLEDTDWDPQAGFAEEVTNVELPYVEVIGK